MTATPELPNNSTAGHDPNKAGHLSNLPYDHVPITDFYNEESQINEEDLTKLQTGEYRSERPPVQELPAPEKKKISLGVKIAAGVAALAAAGGAAWYGATAGGAVNLQPTKPTAEAPVNPGNVPPVVITPAPAPAETVPAVKLPEVVPVEQQKFTDASGQEMSYEEKVAANALPSNLYKNGSEATRAMFSNMEGLLEYYPTDAEVRNNLGYPADQKLTRDDYMLAAGLYADTFDVNYDSKPSATGNSLPSVIRKILMKNVEYRYNQLNDKDTSNDSTPFDVTLTLSQSQTSFTYVDNGPNVTPDAYAITATRGMTISTGEVGNWQYPSNTMLSAKK